MTNYEINSLTPTIGAEISGIDLSNNLNSQDLDNIYKNLIDHKVIFFRNQNLKPCLLYTSPSPRDGLLSRMPSSA